MMILSKILNSETIEVFSEKKPHCTIENCHNNCIQYKNTYGGEIIYCYDVRDNVFVLHSIIYKDDEYLDITPPNEKRKLILLDGKKITDYPPLIIKHPNNEIEIKNRDELYYVYVLLDPRIKFDIPEMYGEYLFYNEPFYVGKGKNVRCWSHLFDKTNSPKVKKIQKILKENAIPEIKIVKSFWSEQEAYDYEEKLISQIGSNYISEIKDGPLLNLVRNSFPPSMKGKTYIEIYGEEKALDLIERKRKDQLAKGGYGPKNQSKETRAKISNSLMGNKHLLNHKHTVESRAKMSKGKIGNKNALGYKHTVKTKEIISNSVKEIGLKWMNNGEIVVRANKNTIKKYLEDGFVFGRKVVKKGFEL